MFAPTDVVEEHRAVDLELLLVVMLRKSPRYAPVQEDPDGLGF